MRIKRNLEILDKFVSFRIIRNNKISYKILGGPILAHFYGFPCLKRLLDGNEQSQAGCSPQPETDQEKSDILQPIY